jgi:phospholipase C
MRRVLLVAIVCLAVIGASPPPGSAQESLPPIEHLVVILEQNSSFDHTLGTLPAVDGVVVGQDVPMAGGRTEVIRGFSSLGPGAFRVKEGEEVLSNGPLSARAAFNGGRMDGFAAAQRATGKNEDLSFTVIDEATPSPWEQLARRGVVFERYFSSYLAGSLPNALTLISGSAQGRERGSSADRESLWDGDVTTVFDEATDAGVSWRYYIGGLDQIDQAKVASGAYARSQRATPSALYWAPILSMRRFWQDPSLQRNVRSQNDFFTDAAAGDLPSITYILPQPTTHEPLVVGPDLRILSILNALQTAPTWSSTAAVVVWDDWGGYYDHVPPPTTLDGEQLGMRVPMLLFSPWAQSGVVSDLRLDHSSIPALATSLFDLKPIAPRTNPLAGVWLDEPFDPGRITALSYAPRYEAAGNENARTVFGLYIVTTIVIIVALSMLGLSLRARPSEGK